MRILLTESVPGVADLAARTFRDAGHEVLRCSPEGAPAFPCAGLAHDECPLDSGIQVVVAVRAPRAIEPSVSEMGVTSALRHRLPVVVVGERDGPFAPWSADHVAIDRGPRLLAAVEAAGRGDSPAHAAVAAGEVEGRLGVLGIMAEAQRRADGIAVTVRVPRGVDAKQRETLGVQVAGALRRFDRYVGVIDVSVAAPED